MQSGLAFTLHIVIYKNIDTGFFLQKDHMQRLKMYVTVQREGLYTVGLQ